ncbi:serine/threonine phosphatase [Halogeometricum pallidum JCM 14848]|uniref:Serine/threonine phosphatase n=1 Tax=Halogeometricum pallidum JCM 14848 TaxID=1227487 RepID=M0DFB8_HALPD|nr:metallophosphoesterase [Halogeometricum pallidum]ELZ33422.1 serine/threonine phosphatase [Halogeometricum pallidum JCM 14848]
MTADSEATGWSGPTRRTILRALGAGATLAGVGAAGSSAQSAEPWTVVALPDTQFYAEDKTSYPRDQAEWIAAARDEENIAYVSHLGDVVEHGDDEAEWEHMSDSLAPLDGTVPYSTLPGNHDWASLGDRTSSIENYQQYFGPSRHEGEGYFGGAGPDDLNTYQLFSAGGYDFLHLALEWEVPGEIDDPSTALGWAQSVLEQYPDRPTIVTTHSYLRDYPQRRTLQVQEDNGIGTEGQTVWEKLIAPNSQVFMVLCGHWHRDDGEAHQVSSNDDGEEVYELLSDFQNRSNGGYGLLRQVQFQPGEGGSEDDPDRIQVYTYSPSTDEFLEDADSEFGFDLDFDARFGSASDGPLAGDADGDGDVDSDDVDAIQRSIAGEDVDINTEAADVDDDGDVDIGDAIRARNISEEGQ